MFTRRKMLLNKRRKQSEDSVIRLGALREIDEGLATNEGTYHPEIVCKDVLTNGGCNTPVRWHPTLKTYSLCGNEKCSNYYICHCGKEFGKHYKK